MHQILDYEKYVCKNMLVELMALLDQVHNEETYNDEINSRDSTMSITFILVDRILKSFDNPDYQNLDQYTKFMLAMDRYVAMDFGYSLRSITEIMNDGAANLMSIEQAIDGVIEKQKLLTEWALGYELTDNSCPSAKIGIYWLIKDVAQEAGNEIGKSEKRSSFTALPVENRICYQCLDGHPHDICDFIIWSMAYPPFAGEYW